MNHTFDITRIEDLDSTVVQLLTITGLNSIWLLSGHLGAGKTELVRHLAKTAMVQQEVSSPSFNLHNIYHGILSEVQIEIHHYDLYRLNQSYVHDLFDLELYSDNFILCVEWHTKTTFNWYDISESVYEIDLNLDIDNNHRKLVCRKYESPHR
ncbi:MAG: tRNA (adenosine(37)-N6)-threonylcarbamoyltransferase complex ATPase subunit type 1 TsaE [Leptospiraceae bacterium]|nr:tRNA (adenosine(37)-N6)-threonylcarbamoyltransferase complex ATPase subunit type 1 TsaE [Leptospiraceae bacterium]